MTTADQQAQPDRSWVAERDRDADEQTQKAQVLTGKTITAAVVEPHSAACDGVNVLRLTMSDGSVFVVEGGYGGYTGHSCDEYYERITVDPA